MDLVLLITGLLQLLLSMFIGVFFVYAAVRVFQKLTRGINETEELKKNNVAVGVLNAAIAFSIIIVVKNSIESSITIFSYTLRSPDAELLTYAKTALLMIGHVLLAGVIAVGIIYTALKIFMHLTKDLDELKEIKENNIAVSIFLSTIIIALALLFEPGIISILDALIPFPQVSILNVGG